MRRSFALVLGLLAAGITGFAQELTNGGNIDPAPYALQLDVHPSGGPSNLDGVIEPGETVQVEPTWRNGGLGGYTLSGVASQLGAPGSLVDATAAYSAPPLGGLSCFDSGGDCYVISVDDASPRPAAHWDASLHEDVAGIGVIGAKTWTLHIGGSFVDVPASSPFSAYIENVLHNGVTAGCGERIYCPTEGTLRRQMAVLVLRAKEGISYVPPSAVGVFADVPADDSYAPWIEELHDRGVVAGCGPGPVYCPDQLVSREQASVFLLKTMLGAGYSPPDCQGLFSDVPCADPFARWVEDLFTRQIAAGCGSGIFCPFDPTTREQSAPLLVKTFGLLLYGP